MDNPVRISVPPSHRLPVVLLRVYGAISRNELFVFDDLAPLLDELCSYSRVLDDIGEPTRDIDDKSSFHCADALRYVIAYLKSGATIWPVSPELPREYQSEILNAPEGVFLVHPRDEQENWQPGSGPGAWSTRIPAKRHSIP